MSNVAVMDEMFCHATTFNQPLHEWNVASVYSTRDMFLDACSYQYGELDIKFKDTNSTSSDSDYE